MSVRSCSWPGVYQQTDSLVWRTTLFAACLPRAVCLCPGHFWGLVLLNSNLSQTLSLSLLEYIGDLANAFFRLLITFPLLWPCSLLVWRETTKDCFSVTSLAAYPVFGSFSFSFSLPCVVLHLCELISQSLHLDFEASLGISEPRKFCRFLKFLLGYSLK